MAPPVATERYMSPLQGAVVGISAMLTSGVLPARSDTCQDLFHGASDEELCSQALLPLGLPIFSSQESSLWRKALIRVLEGEPFL